MADLSLPAGRTLGAASRARGGWRLVDYTPGVVESATRVSETLILLRLRLLKGFTRPLPPQFVMVWVPGLEAVPMSVAGFKGSRLDLLVKPVGDTTRRLVELGAGGRLGLYGPLGRPLIPPGRRFLFVAGGSGLAPILYYLDYLECGVRSVCEVAVGFNKSVEAGSAGRLVEEKGGRPVVYCLDTGCDEKGVVLDHLKRVDPGSYDALVLSGPPEMINSSPRFLGREYWGRVIFVAEALVKCGLGLCGSCRLPWNPGLYLCVDGPGFHLTQLLGVV